MYEGTDITIGILKFAVPAGDYAARSCITLGLKSYATYYDISRP